MDDVFYWVLNMSIIASLAGICILLLRLIRRLPRRFIFVLWMIPFLRMVLPVGLRSEYSLWSLFYQYAPKSVLIDEYGTTLSMLNSVYAAESYFPLSYRYSILQTVFEVAGWIWLSGALVITATVVIFYLRAHREIADAIPAGDGIFRSPRVTTPAVYGIFRPKILLPDSYSEHNLHWVLLHERTHIRRWDNLRRMVAVFTAALHWFNPFVWMFLRCFLADLELSCDERVLKGLNEEEKIAYARTLLHSAESKTGLVSALGGSEVAARISRILTYKRLSIGAAICIVLLGIAIAAVLLTNPM